MLRDRCWAILDFENRIIHRYEVCVRSDMEHLCKLDQMEFSEKFNLNKQNKHLLSTNCRLNNWFQRLIFIIRIVLPSIIRVHLINQMKRNLCFEYDTVY